MALAIAVNKRNIVGSGRKVTFTATFDATYATGGLAISTAQLRQLMPDGPSTITDINDFTSEPSLNGTAVITATLDRTNSKLLAISNGSQAANASDQSASVVRCTIHYGNVSGGTQ